MISTTIKPIRTEQDYDAALLRIESLMMAEADTPEADELEVLATLVELYEEKHYPIGWPGAIGAIRFRMDQAGLSEQDLIPFLGSEANVTQVLTGELALTVSMMRALNEHLGIPAEMLLRQSEMLEALKALSLSEAAELIKQIEQAFGVSAASTMTASSESESFSINSKTEKIEFDVILESVPDDKKISVLKVVRGLSGLGLKEAVDLIEDAPRAIHEGVPKNVAEDAKKQIEQAGGKVAIK
jgi:large subunit ribosomal protein L7/L12